MDKASCQKSTKRQNFKKKLVEAASKFLPLGLSLEMGIAVVKEIQARTMKNPRILGCAATGEVFVYDLSDPQYETPMDSIFETLQRHFSPGDKISPWLLGALFRQPLELVKQGYALYDSDVIILHSTVKGAPISVEEHLQSLKDYVAGENARDEEAFMRTAIPLPRNNVQSARLAM